QGHDRSVPVVLALVLVLVAVHGLPESELEAALPPISSAELGVLGSRRRRRVVVIPLSADILRPVALARERTVCGQQIVVGKARPPLPPPLLLWRSGRGRGTTHDGRVPQGPHVQHGH